MFKILFPLLAFLCFNEATIFKFTNYVCENNAKTVLVLQECQIRAISRDKNALNLNLTLIKPVTYCRLDAQTFKKSDSLSYQPWLFSFTIETCRFVKRPNHPVAIIIYRLFKDFSNLNHSCPYKDSIILKGFHLRSSILPNPFPTGDYLLNMTWNFSNSSHLVTKAYFTFREG